MIKEFKEFAIKGNMVDLAVGVVIGSAFGKIVSSLVSDIIMPPLGLLLGNVDFSKKVLVLKDSTDGLEAVTLNYGSFINNCLDFLIIAFAIFIVIKQINRLKKKEVVEPTTKECTFCISTIPIKASKCHACGSNQ